MKENSAKRLRWRKLKLACAVLLPLIVIGLIFHFSTTRYRGRTLDYWVIQLKQGDQQKKQLAREALQHFGGQAIPNLVDVIKREDGAWKFRMQARFPMLYRFLRTTSAQDRAYAAAALGELGPIAIEAIPSLEQLRPKIGPAHEPFLDAALMKIKGEPLMPIIDALANFQATNWQWLAQTAAQFGTNAQLALPVLCKALQVTNSNVRLAGAYAIGFIRTEPSLCIPALIESVRAGGMGSMNSIWALGEFEADARAAVPVLRQKLNDPDPMIRQSALGSLKRILPADEQASLVPHCRQMRTIQIQICKQPRGICFVRCAPREYAEL